MLKILHTADIHLGAKFKGLGSKGASQREQLRATFKNVIATGIAEKVNVVLIAGDLFDTNQQAQRNIDLVIEQFDLLNQHNIPVCLIPGTHDCLDSSSIYRKVNFQARCANLRIFASEQISYQEYPESDLTVYGSPNLSNRSYTSPLTGLRRATSSKFHVAMAHGSFYIPERVEEDDHVFRPEEIKASGMNYVALGHWHRVYRCLDEPPAWYSGPPEWIPDQRDKGAVLLVSVSDAGEVKVEQRRLGIRDYDELEINMDYVPDVTDLKVRISEGAHPDLIRKVTLRGLRAAELIVDPQELEEDLAGKFFHLSVIDASHAKSKEFAQDQALMVRSSFIRLMKSHIESLQEEERAIAESALQYGVALLDGKEVL